MPHASGIATDVRDQCLGRGAPLRRTPGAKNHHPYRSVSPITNAKKNATPLPSPPHPPRVSNFLNVRLPGRQLFECIEGEKCTQALTIAGVATSSPEHPGSRRLKNYTSPPYLDYQTKRGVTSKG